MKTPKFLLTGALIMSCGFMANAFATDGADPEDFVDAASAKGIAEIESAKLALQKSTSSDVKKFAQTMINDHTAANAELASIARTKKLKVEDEATLTSKAKEYILKQRDGESFDVAYAKNQVSAHEDTIKLFQEATKSKDMEISAFARTTLPKLEHHLEMAHQLEAKATNVKLEKTK
jgi:putative membrane protein